MHSIYNNRLYTVRFRTIIHVISIMVMVLLLGGIADPPDNLISTVRLSSADEPSWWKGNLHTHSLWSDGSHYPENIVDRYKSSGYHFLALSDHNILSIDPNKWINVVNSSGGMVAYGEYLERFGLPWVENEIRGGALYARLKTLEEVRGLFEEPDKFILIQAEEISSSYLDPDQIGSSQLNSWQLDSDQEHLGNHHHAVRYPIHVVAVNIVNLISSQSGESIVEVLQNSINAVVAHRQQTGLPMLAIIAHPNFQDALTAEDIIEAEGSKFFEVYNGHVFAYNDGTPTRPSMDQLWDSVLAERLNNNGEIIYGVAVDDTHTYLDSDSDCCNAKRGWVVVRAQQLDATAIVTAMDQGDFYSSTGVELIDVQQDNSQISIEIREEENVSYSTQFIGTRLGSDKSGVVLATVAGANASYRFACNELYVRSKVTSSKLHEDPSQLGDVEIAWTQPVLVQDCTPNIFLPTIHG